MSHKVGLDEFQNWNLKCSSYFPKNLSESGSTSFLSGFSPPGRGWVDGRRVQKTWPWIFLEIVATPNLSHLYLKKPLGKCATEPFCFGRTTNISLWQLKIFEIFFDLEHFYPYGYLPNWNKNRLTQRILKRSKIKIEIKIKIEKA